MFINKDEKSLKIQLIEKLRKKLLKHQNKNWKMALMACKQYWRIGQAEKSDSPSFQYMFVSTEHMLYSVHSGMLIYLNAL
jgi:hypothetical protein